MATFRPAKQSVHTLVSKVLRECYKGLYDLTKEETNPLTFNLLMVHADLDGNGEPVGPPLHFHGRTAAAVISAVPKAQRALGMADVLIRFDGDLWENDDEMTPEKREALVDHELAHLVLITEEGTPKRDDMGRLRFKMRAHDYEFGWFMDVAKRRGLHSFEVTQAQQIAAEHGQLLFNLTPSLPGMDATPTPAEVAAAAHGFTVMTGGKSEIPAGNLPWEGMDELQREAARDAFQERLDITATFRFDGVRCVGMHVLGQGEIEAYTPPEGDGAPANEREAKAPKAKRTRKAAAARN